MGKRSKQAVRRTPKNTPPASRWPVLAPAILFGASLICYWVPLTSSGVSILWDAADFFQPIQNYLAHELHAGRIPFWSPYPSAGFPFLADPQVGAWYPLNWPFFLVGVTPRAIFAENWLHALVACFGAYLLALRWLKERPPAALAGLCYGLSGFFTEHSSHTPMLQTAAWLPWLLLVFDRAVESGLLRDAMWGGLIAGLLILAGHFQTALYCFFALAILAAARVIQSPGRWPRITITAAALPLMGTALAAVAALPGLELAAHSIRTDLHALGDNYGMLRPAALLTLVVPDYYGAASNQYHGPADITQYYFYGGLLLIPLAAWGLANRALRVPCGLLLGLSCWYMLGPAAGLFSLLARLPGFANIRAPVNGWFVPALALALLAAAGCAQAMARWRAPWLGAALLALFAGDLFYCNFAQNQLAYARAPYDQIYGAGEDLFQRAVTSRLPPLMRFDASQLTPTFGPLAHYFDTRTEVTYGYNPLTLSRYHDYYLAIESNPKLRNELGAALWLDQAADGVRTNPDALPRVTFPPDVIRASSADQSRQLLTTLDPARQVIVPGAIQPATQDPAATARVTEYGPGRYVIRYHCASASVMRVAGAYFDGWRASLHGNTVPVFPADHALIGVLVPAGEGDVTLDYSSKYFGTGAAISLASLFLMAAVIFRSRPQYNKQKGSV
jgi:hypothetical protein